MLTSRWPAARLYAFPTIKILPLVLYKIKEERASVILITPNLLNQPWFPDLTELLVAQPWLDLEGRICYPRWTARCGTQTGVVEPSYVAASGISEGLSALHSRVLNTLLDARAPSTRRLYALKWGVFVKWCG